jgi:hypothetical protein
MIGYLAAYDPGYSSPTGVYWVWQHPRLPPKLLNGCYSALASSHLPEDPNLLAPADLHGGCLALSKEWCCFYRFFDGGRDLSGRPGRFVMLCAFIEREAITGQDCSGLLDADPFSAWAGKQPLQGTPREPEHLEQDFAYRQLDQTTVRVKNDGSGTQTFIGPAALAESWSLCAAIAPTDSFHWRVSRTNGEATAEVQTPVPGTGGSRGSENVSDAKRSTSIPRTSAKRPDPVTSRTRPQISPRRALLKLPIAFILVALVGFAGGFSLRHWGPGAAVTDPSSEAAFKDDLLKWLERYDSDEVGKLIHKDELIRRVRDDDWTPFKDRRSPSEKESQSFPSRVKEWLTKPPSPTAPAD